MALTFANRISDPDEEDEVAYFMGEKYFWDKAIDDFLAELGIGCDVRDVLPVVPTGNYKTLRLPTCENWLSELWMSCHSVMSVSSGLTLYRINKDRLKFSGSSAAPVAVAYGHSCEDDNQVLIPECDTTQGADDPENIPREIPLNQEQEEKFWKKIWAASVNGCERVKHLATNFSHAVLKLITRTET